MGRLLAEESNLPRCWAGRRPAGPRATSWTGREEPGGRCQGREGLGPVPRQGAASHWSTPHHGRAPGAERPSPGRHACVLKVGGSPHALFLAALLRRCASCSACACARTHIAPASAALLWRSTLPPCCTFAHTLQYQTGTICGSRLHVCPCTLEQPDDAEFMHMCIV